MKKRIVISGINLFEGGTLSIYKDCLQTLIENGYLKKYHVTAFVYRKDLFPEFMNSGIEFIELPNSRKNYLLRMYYEYLYFWSWSKKRNIDTWLSIHDMTPNVKAKKRYVYCHNPTPFYKSNLTTFKYSKSVFFMTKLYKYIYGINIKKNTAVIVQQDWIREKFKKMYKVKNIIVANPNVYCINEHSALKTYTRNKYNDKKVFIYASFPRVFKNFEVICKAVETISDKHKFEVWLTIDGSENKYAESLRKKYCNVSNIKWVGLQTREQLQRLYQESDCLIFPSKLETWGLPITEYKMLKKPIIAADLSYSHETVGDYSKVVFFDPNNEKQLKQIMIAFINDNLKYTPHVSKVIDQPFVSTWKELLKMIIGK